MMQRTKTVLVASTFLGAMFIGCAAPTIDDEEADGEISSEIQARCAQLTPGPCAGTPLDTAVRCAQRAGARLLSYYRSPAEQECVRRQNRCTNRCSGGQGCVRPTASCTGSPHTQCRAVDFVADGAPATRAELRACGLAKTTAPHANHYDYVGGGSTSSGTSSSTSGSKGGSTSSSGGKDGATSSSGGKGGGDSPDDKGGGDDGWDDDYGGK